MTIPDSLIREITLGRVKNAPARLHAYVLAADAVKNNDSTLTVRKLADDTGIGRDLAHALMRLAAAEEADRTTAGQRPDNGRTADAPATSANRQSFGQTADSRRTNAGQRAPLTSGFGQTADKSRTADAPATCVPGEVAGQTADSRRTGPINDHSGEDLSPGDPPRQQLIARPPAPALFAGPPVSLSSASARLVRVLERWSDEAVPADRRFRYVAEDDLRWFERELLPEYPAVDATMTVTGWGDYLEGQHRAHLDGERSTFPRKSWKPSLRRAFDYAASRVPPAPHGDHHAPRPAPVPRRGAFADSAQRFDIPTVPAAGDPADLDGWREHG